MSQDKNKRLKILTNCFQCFTIVNVVNKVKKWKQGNLFFIWSLGTDGASSEPTPIILKI